MSIYLVCTYFLIGLLAILAGLGTFLLVKNRAKKEKNVIENLQQKKSTLYIRYDTNTRDVVINNKYSYLNWKVSKYIVDLSRDDEFIDNIKKCWKDQESYYTDTNIEDKTYYFTFSFRDKSDDQIVLRCDYNVEKIIEPITLKSIDDIRKIHDDSENKNASLYYLNIKDFNVVNQRYGQKCGDYVLEVIKTYVLEAVEEFVSNKPFVIVMGKYNGVLVN